MSTDLAITSAFVDTFVNDSAHDSAVVTALGGGNVKVIFAEGITSIPTNCFKDQTNIVAVEFPNTVASIGASAFEGCTGLVSLSLPASAVAIASDAFKGCTALKNMDARALETKAGEALQITADKFAIVHNTVYDDTALAQRVTNAESLWVPNAENTIVSTDKNIGIGTTTPQHALHVHTVNGGMRISGQYQYNTGVIDFCSNGPSAEYGKGTYADHRLKSNANGFYFETAKNNVYSNICCFRDSGNVGIGTDGPNTKLEVDGVTRINNRLELQRAGGPNYIDFRSGELFHLRAHDTSNSANSQNRMTIDGNGNIGIGTDSPDTLLHIRNDTINNSLQDQLILHSHINVNDNGIGILFKNRWDNDVNWNMARICGISDHSYGGQITFQTKPSDLYSHTLPVERMRIGADGNVGIGTTTPQHALHVHTTNGGIRISGQYQYNTGVIDFCSNGPSTEYGKGTYADHRLKSNANGFYFETSKNNVYSHICCFRDSGNVGIGTDSPKAPLEITSKTWRFTSIQQEAGFNNNNWSRWLYYTGDTSFTEGAVWTFNGAIQGGTAPAADLGVSFRCLGSIWVDSPIFFTSDQRIKTDISLVDDDRALKQVNDIETKEYHYIDPERRKPTKTIGFIAQDVKEICPNAIHTNIAFIPDEGRVITNPDWSVDASGNHVLTIDDIVWGTEHTGQCQFYVSNDVSGNDEELKKLSVESDKKSFIFDMKYSNIIFHGKEVNDLLSIDKNQIFALHHSAIQELSRKNNALEAKNAAKDNEIAQLKADIALIKQNLGL